MGGFGEHQHGLGLELVMFFLSDFTTNEKDRRRIQITFDKIVWQEKKQKKQI